MFFIDGARDLQNAIMDMLGWRYYKKILDWYHLEKKRKELFSMGIKGKAVKEGVLTMLLSLLWLRKVDEAVEYLKNLNINTIKCKKKIAELIGYFDRNMSSMPCYALRKSLD